MNRTDAILHQQMDNLERLQREEHAKRCREACNRVAHENYVRESTRDVKNCGDWMDREKARKNKACLEFGI